MKEFGIWNLEFRGLMPLYRFHKKFKMFSPEAVTMVLPYGQKVLLVVGKMVKSLNIINRRDLPQKGMLKWLKEDKKSEGLKNIIRPISIHALEKLINQNIIIQNLH